MILQLRMTYRQFIINIKSSFNNKQLPTMILVRRLIRLSVPIRKIALQHRNVSYFGQNIKKSIDEQLLQFADSIKQSNPKEDMSDIANNYIQLQQQSFAEYAKQNNDPQMMLMFLSTFQDPNKISQYLPTLYGKIDFFEKNELLLLMQNVLAFKPSVKPKVPYPKPLEEIQSILVVMSEIFPADKLIQWMKLVPLYQGKSHYVLYMGYFSILQKMSPELKSRNQKIWAKCHEKIVQVLQDQQISSQIKLGIVTLAFELNYGQAARLFLCTKLSFQAADPYKLCLLFIHITNYLLNKSNTNIGIQQEETKRINKMLKKSTNQICSQLSKLNFIQFIKIQLFVQLWQIIGEMKEINGVFIGLVGKLLNVINDKQFKKQINQLSVKQIMIIFSAMEKHKVNNQKTVKMLLVLLSTHLNNMDKSEFIALLKCLVTYVRQCEDYLISVRTILEERKLQFNPEQIVQINEILRRVEVLFPRKFQLK